MSALKFAVFTKRQDPLIQITSDQAELDFKPNIDRNATIPEEKPISTNVSKTEGGALVPIEHGTVVAVHCMTYRRVLVKNHLCELFLCPVCQIGVIRGAWVHYKGMCRMCTTAQEKKAAIGGPV